MFRYEFLEILVRFASHINNKQVPKQPGNKSIDQILKTLITEQVIQNSQSVNRIAFRRYLINNVNVSELLNRNAEVLKASFDYFTSLPKKKTVNLEECVALSRQWKLDVPDQILGIVFAESLMTVVDTVRNRERMYQLSYPEYLYFLCKITEVHFTNTEYEMEDFHVKLDNLLPCLLEPMDLAP